MVGRKRGFRKPSIRCWQAVVTADFSTAERPLDLMCPLGSRRFGTAWQGLSPVPGQKFVQPVESEVVDAREHVGKPGLRVDIVELADMIKVAMTAARSSPRSEPANSQHLPPRAKPRRARSAALLVRQIRPSSMKRAKRSHRLSI